MSYESANLLAAVSVALMSDTSVELAAQMLPEGHALRSAAYLDAVEAVKKIIDLRARISALEAERDRLKETIKHAIAVLNTVDSEAWEKNTITYGTATRVKSVMQDCREIIGGERK